MNKVDKYKKYAEISNYSTSSNQNSTNNSNNNNYSNYNGNNSSNNSLMSNNSSIYDKYVSTSNKSTDDYIKMANRQEYSALLDKEIELENAKQNAIKYTNNQIAAQGLDRQGYGSSQMASIYNQYNNALAQERNNFNTSFSESSNERFGNIMTMLSDADNDIDLMNTVLSDYGYGEVGADGKFVFGDKPSDLTDDDWYRIKYSYNVALSEVSKSNSTYYKDIDSFKNNAIFQDADGKYQSVSTKFVYETKTLEKNLQNGDYTAGTVVLLQNKAGNKVYVKVGNNNELYLVSESDYLEATQQGKNAHLIWGLNVSHTSGDSKEQAEEKNERVMKQAEQWQFE